MPVCRPRSEPVPGSSSARVTAPPSRSARPARLRWAALVAALAACALAAPAGAQRGSAARVWAAADLDSVRILARDALSHFRTNQGDSTTSENYYAYLQVGRAGRRLLRSLGRDQLIQAHAIRPLLDSVQLETEIRVDAELPHLVLLMMRNPFRRTAEAVGFLYWYRSSN